MVFPFRFSHHTKQSEDGCQVVGHLPLAEGEERSQANESLREFYVNGSVVEPSRVQPGARPMGGRSRTRAITPLSQKCIRQDAFFLVWPRRLIYIKFDQETLPIMPTCNHW